MCNYEILFHNDETGYVVRCLDCDKLQIGFGNLMLTLNMEGFAVFHSCLRKVKDEQTVSGNESLRCITIPTPCEGVKLLLSLREVKSFDQMLEAADSELRSLQMINLFSANS